MREIADLFLLLLNLLLMPILLPMLLIGSLFIISGMKPDRAFAAAFALFDLIMSGILKSLENLISSVKKSMYRRKKLETSKLANPKRIVTNKRKVQLS